MSDQEISDNVIKEYDEMLQEVTSMIKTIPIVEVSKRVASYSATFLSRLMEQKTLLAKVSIELNKLTANEYRRLRYGELEARTSKEANQELILNQEIDVLKKKEALYELRVEFFDRALKVLTEFNFTCNGLVKFQTMNNDEM